MTDLFNFSIFGRQILYLRIDLIFLIGVLLVLILAIIVRRKQPFFKDWDIVEADIKLGGAGTVKIKPDFEDIQIAHRAWIELATRKAGIEFDEENDVIIEVYNSWYQLFGEMRKLARDIPCGKVRSSENTEKLIFLLVNVLNLGLRPHLTKWQARFRTWFNHQSLKYPTKSPQEIQKLYPKYKMLIKDLKYTNKAIIEYTDFIKRIAHGDNTNLTS